MTMMIVDLKPRELYKKPEASTAASSGDGGRSSKDLEDMEGGAKTDDVEKKDDL